MTCDPLLIAKGSVVSRVEVNHYNFIGVSSVCLFDTVSTKATCFLTLIVVEWRCYLVDIVWLNGIICNLRNMICQCCGFLRYRY